MYSLLSLLYAAIAELVLGAGIYVVILLLGGNVGDTSSVTVATEQFNQSIANNRTYIANNYNAAAPHKSGVDALMNKENTVIVFIIAILVGVVLFITFFLLLTKKFVIYLDQIADGINEIASGDFDTRIHIENEDEFALIASRLNQMAVDIKELMEKEREGENAKNDLITSIAHDIRTPLTSIIGYLDLVSSKNINEDIKSKYIDIAYNKSKRLESLMNDLFTYTKFNHGQVTISFDEVDIVKLVDQLLDEFYPSFQENNLEFEFHTDKTSQIIEADGNLLARAIANLFSNAIKYGRDGKRVEIFIQMIEDYVYIIIKNYGEIIPEKDIHHIFDKFYRVDNSRSSETGGTGLGLAIAKSIILIHQGEITAESSFEGTIFEVKLPIKK